MITFGPIPSRRLGFSLGINNIPVKHCSYACTYCQAGPTHPLEIQRQAFYPVDEIVAAVAQKVAESEEKGQAIDFLSFVPDGEPTLDVFLAEEIEALRVFNIPIAVISNASLIHDPAVIDALCRADWVSLKVDSVVEETWRAVNRPYGKLQLASILEGIKAFRGIYDGSLATETMLIRGVNDDANHLRKVAVFLTTVKPNIPYLSIPIRPPTDAGIEAPSSAALQQAFEIFSKMLPTTVALFELEEPAFISTGNLREDILSITAVHPLRKAPLRKMIAEADGDWSVVEALVKEGSLIELVYNGERFFRQF